MYSKNQGLTMGSVKLKDHEESSYNLLIPWAFVLFIAFIIDVIICHKIPPRLIINLILI